MCDLCIGYVCNCNCSSTDNDGYYCRKCECTHIRANETGEKLMKIKLETCGKTIEFGDDYGDNSCTFSCELQNGHDGQHRETGDIDGSKYTLYWMEVNSDDE